MTIFGGANEKQFGSPTGRVGGPGGLKEHGGPGNAKCFGGMGD